MIILDEIRDSFIFLNKDQTNKLIAYFKSGNFDSFLEDLLLDNIISPYKNLNYFKINFSLERKIGIDNYEWRLSKNFRRTEKSRLKNTYGIILIFSTIFLNLFGFHKMLNIMRKLNDFKFKKIIEINEIEVVSNFDFFNKIIPFKNSCLEYSIAGYIIFTILGYKPNFYIGLQNYDFISHAWIEINGKVIGDIPDIREKLHIILSI